MTEVTNEDINVSTWKIPSPLGIIGSHAEGEFNGMTASWITQVSMEPALIGVGIDNKSVTFDLMNRSEYFTLNMFSPEYTKVFVKFSKPAEYSEGFLNKEPITLTKNSVPIFDNATVWFELKTNQKIYIRSTKHDATAYNGKWTTKIAPVWYKTIVYKKVYRQE